MVYSLSPFPLRTPQDKDGLLEETLGVMAEMAFRIRWGRGRGL